MIGRKEVVIVTGRSSQVAAFGVLGSNLQQVFWLNLVNWRVDSTQREQY